MEMTYSLLSFVIQFEKKQDKLDWKNRISITKVMDIAVIFDRSGHLLQLPK